MCQEKRIRDTRYMMNIYAVKLDDTIEENLFETLLSYVQESKKVRIQGYFRRDDAVRTLMSDILARVIIRNSLGISSRQITFGDNGHGKPLLQGYPDYHFNISHSGDWIVYAESDCEVGIDIEMTKPVNCKIAKRFFSPEEYRDLMCKSHSEKQNYFYDLWTLKESYIKATGRGLGASLSSFYINAVKDKITFKSNEPDKTYFFKQYYIDEGYKLSVCSSKNSFPEKVNIFTYKDLEKKFLEHAG